jgi:hypothetical protein
LAVRQAGLNSDKHAFIRKLIVISLLLFIATGANAQFKEIGLGIGGYNYSGDLVRGYDFTNNRLGAHIFYRRNTRKHINFRYQVGFGRLVGDDNNPIDILAQQRQASFDIFVLEGSAMVEYNFLDFRADDSSLPFTPYFFAGISLIRMFGVEESEDEFSLFQPVIPFGVGIKYRLSQYWNLSLEFGPRKTFTDYLDNVSGGDLRLRDFDYGNKFDDDWYYHFGLSVSYVFYTLPCLFPYN